MSRVTLPGIEKTFIPQLSTITPSTSLLIHYHMQPSLRKRESSTNSQDLIIALLENTLLDHPSLPTRFSLINSYPPIFGKITAQKAQ
jgi:hypothetical protein